MACVQATLDIRESLAQPRIALHTPFDLANCGGHTGVMAQAKHLGNLG
jgi:hypothetical protein